MIGFLIWFRFPGESRGISAAFRGFIFFPTPLHTLLHDIPPPTTHHVPSSSPHSHPATKSRTRALHATQRFRSLLPLLFFSVSFTLVLLLLALIISRPLVSPALHIISVLCSLCLSLRFPHPFEGMHVGIDSGAGARTRTVDVGMAHCTTLPTMDALRYFLVFLCRGRARHIYPN